MPRIFTMPVNISSNWFLKKLAHMFKEYFNYWARNCSVLMWTDRNRLEDNTSQYGKISLVYGSKSHCYSFLGVPLYCISIAVLRWGLIEPLGQFRKYKIVWNV
jgi:hypothetical protein